VAGAPPLSPAGAPARVVALAGATGLVGRGILEGLLADASVVTRARGAALRRDAGLSGCRANAPRGG
jgi:aspartate-semialdehyde dehydrogenase